MRIERTTYDLENGVKLECKLEVVEVVLTIS